jgi:hypothetical protein
VGKSGAAAAGVGTGGGRCGNGWQAVVAAEVGVPLTGALVNKVSQGRTGARGSFYADRLRSSYARRLAPCHSALQQEVNKSLCLCTLVVYLGREGEQGAPYSSLTIHIVPPLACMGLGNVKRKHGLVCL